MEIPVVIEPVAGDGYLARMGEPLSLSAAGASRHDALRNLQQAVRQRLESGTTLASLHVGVQGEDSPWITFAGMFKDEPMFDDVRRIMAGNRTADDADPDYL
jgi:predicted RNase H-like HicB family nuclease